MIDIDKLSRDEKLDLLERLWDSLAETQESVPLQDWQREELNRRLDDFERDGDLGAPAEDVLGRLHARNE